MSNLYLGPLTVSQTLANFGGVSVTNVNSISVLSAPIQAQNLANKQYVDSQISTLATDRLNALMSGSTLQLDTLVEIVDYFNGLDAAAAGNVTSSVSNLQNSIGAEETRALAAETILQSNLDAEETRAVASEEALQSNLNAEALRAHEAEGVLLSNLDAEALRAQNAEGVLQSNLDAEALRAQAAESLVQSNLDAEALRAQAAESALDVYSRDTRTRLDALYMYFKHHDSKINPSTGVPF